MSPLRSLYRTYLQENFPDFGEAQAPKPDKTESDRRIGATKVGRNLSCAETGSRLVLSAQQTGSRQALPFHRCRDKHHQFLPHSLLPRSLQDYICSCVIIGEDRASW